MTRNMENAPGPKCATRYRAFGLSMLVVICTSQLLLIAGCHRGFYRRQADAEARRLIVEKQGSRWNSATGDITIDPASRMYDPFSADHPPIPPDDPASHKLMHEVDQKPGYPHWHANGNIDQVENPTWRSYLPTNEKGEVVLTLSDAYRMALIHSPDLQQQRETLYLSALEVSIQRFGFDSQLFAGFNSFLTTAGRFQNASGTSSTTLESSLGVNGGGLQASRMGITGANFVVGLANSIIWEFAGNNTQSANSLINFSVIQPLLRDAGRERVLESLTQAERTLLANVRQLERFRRGFYLQIATGRNAGAGTTQNSSAFLNQPGLAGSNVGGYLGLLQQRQQIKNLEFSVAQFESLLKQFRDLFDKDRIDKLQVAQFESSVYGQQQSLLNSRINYENSLDAFKVLLGLPPDVDVVIEDPFLDAFKLIDDTFPERLASIRALREDVSRPVIQLGTEVRQLYREALLQEEAGEEPDLDDSELSRSLDALQPLLMQAKQLVTTIKAKDRNLVQKDIDKLASTRSRRLKYLSSVKADIESGRLESQVEPRVFTEDSLPTKEQLEFQLDNEANRGSLISSLDGLIEEIDDRISRIKEGEDSELEGSKYYRQIEGDFVRRIPDLLTEINSIVLGMALLQASARTNIIEITDVKIDADDAFETARCLRRDWMNARAALVDDWRQIEFFADQLESQVDLVLTGEIGNAGSDNPFRIRYEDGNLRGGFQFDAPIVRQSERNAYRQAQIAYQQSRRSYYQFSDAINQSLRQTIRNINQDKLLFELNRQSIQVNIDQVQLARSRLVQPPAPGQASTLGDVTANNLTNAIQAFTGSQNQYLGLWAEYEVLRRSLDFDMGTMELDSQLEWVDPGVIDQSIGARVAAREGVAENDRFCCGMNSQVQYQEQFLDVEAMPVSEVVIEAPVNEAPPTRTRERTRDMDVSPESPPVPQVLDTIDPPQVQIPEVPLVEPKIELPSLDSTRTTTPRNYSEAGTVFRTSSISSEPISRSSSSREGYLDPFRNKYGNIYSRQRLVGASELSASRDVKQPATPALDQAFRIRDAEPSAVAEEESVKAKATILMR